MAKSLRIGLWNANGLANRRQEAELFLNTQELDVLLISETHFTDKNYFKIPKYTFYDTKHPDNKAHGGTAVIIKSNLRQYESTKLENKDIQATTVIIEDLNGPLAISAVYCPPKYKITKGRFKDYFENLGHKFIAGGDYNAKHPMWGSRLITPRGRELQQCITEKNYDSLSTGQPTYWPSDPKKIPDLLDFFVVNGISNNYTNVTSCLDICSDHTPVILTVSLSVIMKIRSPALYNKYTDWDSFRRWIENNITLNLPLKTEIDIDNATEYLTKLIQEAAWRSTPLLDSKKETSLNYSKEIKRTISEKRKLRSIWQKYRRPEDKTKLNKCIKELKQLLFKLKNDTFQEYLTDLSATNRDDYSLWKITKKLKRPQRSIPPIRSNGNNWAKSNLEKAELFAKHLSSVFTPNSEPKLQCSDDEITEFLDVPLQMSLPIQCFSPNEVKKGIETELHPKKCPGYDLITAKVLLELPRKAIVFITTLFNCVLRTSYYPAQWKVSQIIMIPKPGKPPHEVTSYRPISLLPILSKLFEKLFLKRLAPILHDKSIIPDHQFGFRREHSTIEQIHRVINEIEDDIETSQYCSAVFLDILQAFDKVWHLGLLYKLKVTLPQPYYLLLRSYLTSRIFQVKFEEQFSHFYDIHAGVPQGSVLGPILYSIYTSDFPISKHVLVATFADDTAILSSHEDPSIASQQLQTELNVVEEWLTKWRIKVSETKSVHLTFGTRPGNCPPVTLYTKELPVVDHVKYLGMHLDRRLTWKMHIKTKCQELKLKTSKMYWLLGPKSQLSLENKLLLYKVILKPVWTYGIQLWGTASNSNIEILQRYQSKTLRSIVAAPWYVRNAVIHKDLNISTIKEEITKISTKYIQRLYHHPNHYAVNLLNNSEKVRRLKRSHTLDLSYIFC